LARQGLVSRGELPILFRFDPAKIMNANASILARRRRVHRRAGQALVEYALVLAFVSVVAITVLMAMGVQVRGVYGTIIDALDRVRTSIS
jgi:Flp pilus assembly pilin Flp